jgi:hypothetical protein
MTSEPSARTADWTVGVACVVVFAVAVITAVVRHGSGSDDDSGLLQGPHAAARCDPAAASRAAARITRETLTINYHHEAAYLKRLRADLVDTDTSDGKTAVVRSARGAWPTVTAQQRIDTVVVHSVKLKNGDCRKGTYIATTTQRRTHYRHLYGYTATFVRHVRDTITVALVGKRFLAYGLPSPLVGSTPIHHRKRAPTSAAQ